jgi:hypothetical protein
MADNVTANSGSGGAVFATDDIGSVHYPRSKVVWGPDGTANDTAAASGKGLPVQGEAAHDAATTGNPVLIGAECRTSDGTAVSNGDVVRLITDTLGKTVVLQGALHTLRGTASVNYTNTSAADLVAAGGAGVKIVVTSILVTNAAAAVSTKVTIRDKTTTTRKIVGYAYQTGGGFTFSNGGAPILISDANSAIEAVCGTTSSDTDVSVHYYTITN